MRIKGMVDKLEIKCPNCNEKIELDNAAYAAVVNQVRTHEFKQDVARAVAAEKEHIEKHYAEELEYYKNYKLQKNIKNLGEELEQYVSNRVLEVQPYMFPNSTFEKDNDQSKGSKGDFIFRSFENDVENLSVMIECKNEEDASKNKKKNESHFAKLDKDRNIKDCEYAILVSMLEQDSEFYNVGIREVPSTQYEKMYVVRPQYLVQVLALLNNVAKSKTPLFAKIAELEKEHADLERFEHNLDGHKEKFERNHLLSEGNNERALEDIEKAIAALESARDRIIIGKKQAQTAAKVVAGLTVRKIKK